MSDIFSGKSIQQKEEQGRHARRKSEFHPQLKSLDSIDIIQEAAAAKKFKPGGFTVGKQIKNVEAVPLEVSPESSACPLSSQTNA